MLHALIWPYLFELKRINVDFNARKSFLRVRCDQKLNHAYEQKTGSTKSEKWRHARTSVEIAWTYEEKADLKWLWRHMVVTKILKKWKTYHDKSWCSIQRFFIE